jgi:hypothetical protein
MTHALSYAIAIATLAAGCGGGGGTEEDSGAPRADAPIAPVDAPPAEIDSGERADTGVPCPDTMATGDQSGVWCGNVTVIGQVRVPAGETLTVSPGTRVVLRAVAIDVVGTMSIEGTAGAHVTFAPEAASWTGIVVSGTLNAAFADITGATNGIQTEGTTVFTDGSIVGSSSALYVAGEVTVDRSRIVGGSTLVISAGTWRMTDTLVDLERPITGPDCTLFNGGTAILDHVRITGCHCPLHMASTSAPMTVTNSIFDGATNPVMIANTMGDFHGNVFDGAGNLMLDIGGGIDVDVGDNYWMDGGAADIASPRLSQFRNSGMVLASPPAGVGPR